MRAERGRAPDFGDPAAIVATLDTILKRRLAVVGDLEKVRLALDIADDATALTATLTPRSCGRSRTHVGRRDDGGRRGALARPAVGLAARRLDARQRSRSSGAGKELEKAITMSLGQRLADPSRLHDVIEAAIESARRLGRVCGRAR